MDVTSIIAGEDESPKKMFDDVEAHLDELAEECVDQIGVPTGFPRYDFAIGGGLRKGNCQCYRSTSKEPERLYWQTT